MLVLSISPRALQHDVEHKLWSIGSLAIVSLDVSYKYILAFRVEQKLWNCTMFVTPYYRCWVWALVSAKGYWKEFNEFPSENDSRRILIIIIPIYKWLNKILNFCILIKELKSYHVIQGKSSMQGCLEYPSIVDMNHLYTWPSWRSVVKSRDHNTWCPKTNVNKYFNTMYKELILINYIIE